jgi:cytochrome c
MGELGVNKILGALLATALGLLGLHQLSGVVFSHGEGEGHHGEEHAEATSMSEQMCAKFAYCIEVAGSGATEAAEEVFDLGALLASADASKGERTFKAQCSTCHTVDNGGANGTGPNLHGVVGAPQGKHPGFTYSATFAAMDGSWSYEHLNDWLNNPSTYARGTAMSFAGLRRDADRANVIAYLAVNTPDAPAFPAPLATSSGEAAPAEGEAAVEGDAPAANGTEAAEVEGETPAEVAPEATETEAAPAEEAPAEEPAQH